MGFWRDYFLGEPSSPAAAPAPRALSIGDPMLLEIIRAGQNTTADSMRNAAVYRCVTLISNTIGMLPLQLYRSGAAGAVDKAREHPLFDLLASQSNPRHTAFEFRRLMQQRVLLFGNAYARIVRNGSRVVALLPIDPRWVTVTERADFSLRYQVSLPAGGTLTIDQADMLHVMGPSNDGITGMRLLDHAADVLELARGADRAAARVFRNGVMAGAVLSTDNKLNADMIQVLREQLEEKFAGAENAGRTLILENGLKPQAWASSLKDAQNIELRAQQVEEVARLFGVPRPFLMLDDTSWGTGIEQLGIFFVQYGLAPWFVAWEQAIHRSLLSPAERRTHHAKFNERALLRGSMKDQAEFFAKALGAGGAPGWMTQDEVREVSELPEAGGRASELNMGTNRDAQA